MRFIKGYKEDAVLRKSFNKLAMRTFGIDFEDWYEEGYWTDKYIPYSMIENDEVIANVSVNLLQLVVEGRSVPAIQIGTVMTDKEYRNRGLSRLLMEKVLEDYEHIEIMYLFANESVLDFYPKFGFDRVTETLYSVDVRPSVENPLKIQDLEFVYESALKRHPSTHFGTEGAVELLMFYALKVFTNDIYYLEQDQAVAICQYEGSTMHIFDVISRKQVNLLDIVNQLSRKETSKAVLHFTPDNARFQSDVYQGETVLFVKNTGNIVFPKHFKHPITSQA